jgi:hypothetical protein
MLRFILRILCFWRASENRREIERDLKSSLDAQRAKAGRASQDYLLSRDLAAMKGEGERKR